MPPLDQWVIINQESAPDWVIFHVPFSPDFNRKFKDSIPYGFRQAVWSSATPPKFCYWTVHQTYVSTLEKLIRLHWPESTIRHRTQKATLQLRQQPDFIKDIFDACPGQNIDRVYRALSLAFHPDVGGDNETMKKINLEYEGRKKK
jgi:hypothetical protein